MKMLINKKAQSTAEYVIVLGLIVAAVMAMQTYVKRGFQGRIKDAVDFTDNAGTGVNFKTKQYEPYYLSSNFNTNRASTENEDLAEGGAVNRDSTENTTRTGDQTITATQQ
jgi:hypothetical protein